MEQHDKHASPFAATYCTPLAASDTRSPLQRAQMSQTRAPAVTPNGQEDTPKEGSAELRACIDGAMFRASKYFDPARLKRECAEFADEASREYCVFVGEAGMYGMQKVHQVKAYTVDAKLADVVGR
jgi:hypothetical protein